MVERMTETTRDSSMGNREERLAITRGVMNLLESWGLQSEEMRTLLDLPGKARHMAQYRYDKVLPDSPEVRKRVEYLVRINEALRTTYPTNPGMGKRWLRRRSRMFNQASPLSMMIGEGEQGMVYVLCRLDCTYAWDQSGSLPC
jgi:hypothetical protein